MKYKLITTTGVILLVLGVTIVIIRLTSGEMSVVKSIAGGGSTIAIGAMLLGVSQMLRRKNASTNGPTRSMMEAHNTMEQKQRVIPSFRTEAIAALLSASAGSGIGWLIWLATSNIGVAIGIAGPISALSNVFLRKIIK